MSPSDVIVLYTTPIVFVLPSDVTVYVLALVL